MVDDFDDVDFALAAFEDRSGWTVQELTRHHLVDVETLADALRRLPGEAGAVGMVAMDEDFFLIVRVAGPRTRVLLSDVTAAEEWELAASALELLGVPLPDEDDEQRPAGDLDLLADLGMHPMDLELLIEDYDLYPDEVLSDVSRRLGFGELFDDAVGLTSA